jgi:uncharacterized damage-inducible protein DinB
MAAHPTPLVSEIVALIDGGGAHPSFRRAVAGLPPAKRGAVPKGAEHSAWQLLEHLRLAQRDILDYCVDATYETPEWPADYWPEPAPPGASAWDRSVRAYLADQRAFVRLISDRKRDLLAPLPFGRDGTLLEEAFLIANHGSYHVGQLVQLRRLLGAWPPKSKRR